MITAAEVDILLTLVERVTTWAATIKKAHDEGRTLTSEEIDSFVAADDASILKAQEAYARAKSEGR